MPSPPPRKAISAVVAVVLLLMMTVAAAGVAYVWTTGMQKGVQEGTSAQAQSLQEAASSCMSIDSVAGRNVYLRNCGTGTIDSKTLLIYFDGIPANGTLSPPALKQGEVGTLALSGIWNLAYGKHALKITNGNAEITQNVIAEVQKDGLVGYWGFDEGSGTTAYDGAGKNNGVLKNFQFDANDGWLDGKSGKALKFDGTNDYVEAPSSGYDLEKALTISYWVKMNAIPSTEVGVGQLGYNKWLYINPGGGAGFNVQSSAPPFLGFSSASGLSLGTWYHLTGTFIQNGANMEGKIYINGNLDSSQTVTNTPFNTVGYPIRFGTRIHDFAGYLNGVIDDVKIYSKALTPDDTINLKAA